MNVRRYLSRCPSTKLDVQQQSVSIEHNTMALPNPQIPLEEWDLKFAAGVRKDHVFYIHKSVVFPRSGWFSSCDHDNVHTQPSSDNKMYLWNQTDLDSNLDTISRMLWYLYFGDYSYTTLNPFEIEGLPKAQQPHYALESDGDDEDIRSGRRSFIDVLLVHVRMFCAARHYDYPGLMKLAKEKCIARLKVYRECGVSRFDNTQQLRDAKTLVEGFNLEDLVFFELGEAVEVHLFVANVLVHAVKKVTADQKKIAQLEARTTQLEARLEDMEEKERRRKAKEKKDEESDEVAESRKKIEELEKKLKELELGSSVGEGWEELQMED